MKINLLDIKKGEINYESEDCLYIFRVGSWKRNGLFLFGPRYNLHQFYKLKKSSKPSN
jgi:hypothetical protein